jgi:hypothetical protein
MNRWPGLVACIIGAFGVPFALVGAYVYLFYSAKLAAASNVLFLTFYFLAIGVGFAFWLGILAFSRTRVVRGIVGFFALPYLMMMAGLLYTFMHYLIWQVIRGVRG